MSKSRLPKLPTAAPIRSPVPRKLTPDDLRKGYVIVKPPDKNKVGKIEKPKK